MVRHGNAGPDGITENAGLAGESGVARDLAELSALITLTTLPGIGPKRLSALLAGFGNARAALAAPAAWFGERAAAARDLASTRERVARAVATMSASGHHVITQADPSYPDRLRHLYDPPPVLFVRGRPELLSIPGIAIVGTRKATEYGRSAARSLGKGLAHLGVPVISGLALGIDGAAHAATLEAGGDTIAVLGTGLDVVYPRLHTRLQAEIGRRGLLVSEFPPGTPPGRYSFPRRNRIIAGLAEAVVVVEAPLKSGAKSTVDHALAIGRDVGAVPGPIGRVTSEGTNALIKTGAVLIRDAADIVREVRALGHLDAPRADRARRDAETEPKGEGSDVWRALEDGPKAVDALAAALGRDASEVLALLLRLELQGTIRALPGARFARV